MLYGLPGVGKTQVAAMYCKSFKDDYEIIIWVSADTKQKLLSHLSGHALALKLDGSDTRNDIISNATVLLAWLEHLDVEWLLVFDNVDDIELLREFWPVGNYGNVILTSRDPYLHTVDFGDLENIKTKPLNQQESLSLFYKVAEKNENTQHGRFFDEVFPEWGGIPMAITHMGLFIKNNFLTLDAFSKLYQESSPMIHVHTNAYDSYPHSIATAFSVEKLDAKERSILQLLSYFDPDSIPSDLIYSGFHGGSGSATVSTRIEYVEALDTLRRRSLVDQDNRTLSIHRLTQAVVYSTMTQQERLTAFQSALDILLPAYPTEAAREGSPVWSDWDICERYRPHVLFLCQRFSRVYPRGHKHPKLAQLLCACTWYLFERGLFSEAEDLLEIAQSTCDASDSPVLANILFNLAGIRCECNRIREARDLCERSLSIREKVLPANDQILGNTYYSMGLIYMEEGKYDEALQCHFKSVHVRELSTDKDIQPTAFTFQNLALCYLAMNRLDDAANYMERAEEIWREAGVMNSDRYADTLFDLGNVRAAQGMEDEAFSLHKETLRIREEVTPSHDKTGHTMHKVATYYQKQGRYDEAVFLLEKAVDIYNKNYDPRPRVARSLYLMSEILEAMGQLERASTKRREASELRKTITTFDWEKAEDLRAYNSLVCSFFR